MWYWNYFKLKMRGQLNYLKLYPVYYERMVKSPSGVVSVIVAQKLIYAANQYQAELLANCIMDKDCKNGYGTEFDSVYVGESIEQIENRTKFT